MKPAFGHVVVIGASAGGVAALLEITKALPHSFAAPICIVQHVGRHPSLLPELLRYRRPNRAVHVEDGQRLAAGTLHIAPPDHHLLIDGETLRLTHGPKENHARPAIDPLFRSAAVAWGPRVIGVILTGQMDDGAAGLKAVKDCGGVAIVQEPATAAEPGMPTAALASTQVDHCVPLEQIVPLLQRLVGSPPPPRQAAAPEQIVREVAIHRGDAKLENLLAIATPSLLSCPECGGILSEVREQKPLR
jgi:two-component system chemotaxis response regulator CheB